MIKKLKKIIFTILLLSFVTTVNAASLKVSVKCSDVTVGNTTTCTISASSSTPVSAISGNYSISNGASISSFSAGSGFNGEGSNGSFDLYTDSNKKSFTIGTLKVKGNKTGKVTLNVTGLSAFDADFADIGSISNASSSFYVNAETTTTKTTTSKETTTSTRNTTEITTTTTAAPIPLKLDRVTVDDFNVTYENGVYYVTVTDKTESVMINAEAHANITVIGTGKRNLAEGKNSVDLVLKNNLTSETAVVQVIITRPDNNESHDTLLKNLKVVNYPFKFSANKKEYTITVPYNVKELYIIAEANNPDVEIIGDKVKTLSKGKNIIFIKSSYGDLARSEYKITVKRSYSLIYTWIIIGILILLLILYVLYSYFNKTDAIKNALSKNNREIAENNRISVSLNDPKASINGQNVVGIGRKTLIPKTIKNKIVETPAPLEDLSINDNKMDLDINIDEEIDSNDITPIIGEDKKQVKVIKKKVIPTTKSIKTIKTIQTINQNTENSPNDENNNIL